MFKKIIIFLLFFVFYTNALYAKNYQMYVNKFIKWLQENRDSEIGLPYSHVGDDRFEKWTITYDSAVTSLAFLATKEIGDAQRIINFYIANEQVWRLGGIIEAFSIDSYFQGQDWTVRTGANLWMAIAGFHLYKETKQNRYLDFAKKITNLAISLQNKNAEDSNYGGVSLGPKGNPAYSGDQYLNYDTNMPQFCEIYATEINIDAYALFGMLYLETNDTLYAKSQSQVLKWLERNSYNNISHRFNRGFNDKIVATDIQSWAISTFGLDMLNDFEENAAEKIIKFVEENCISEVSFKKPNGEIIKIKGVDFIDKKRAKTLGRKPLVSPEWTFQLTNAYQRLINDFKEKNDKNKEKIYQTKQKELIDNMLKLAINVNGFLAYPYATQAETIIGHEYKTPKENNFSAIGISYGILALLKYDPLDYKKLFRNTN